MTASHFHVGINIKNNSQSWLPLWWGDEIVNSSHHARTTGTFTLSSFLRIGLACSLFRSLWGADSWIKYFLAALIPMYHRIPNNSSKVLFYTWHLIKSTRESLHKTTPSRDGRIRWLEQFWHPMSWHPMSGQDSSKLAITLRSLVYLCSS